jgi:hypothetical protein
MGVRDLWNGVRIGWLDLLHVMHSRNSGLQAIQRYRYFTHTLQFTVAHTLEFSVFTSHILATDLQQSHCHLKSQMESSFHSLIPFLPLYCSCQFRRLDSVQFLCCQAHILAGWRLETRLITSRLLTLSFWILVITTLHDPTEKNLCCLLIRCLAIDVLLLS